jgi:C2 domain
MVLASIASPTTGMDSRVVQIFVSKISTTKLRNVEMMYGDKNDVFLLMKFGDMWNARTATMWEGGSDVSWLYSESADTNMKWTATVSDIMSGSLSITAMDDNKMTSSKLIGVGEQQIVLCGALLQEGSAVSNTEVLVEVPLLEKIGGKAAGTVSVTLLIKSAPITPAAAAPAAAVIVTAAPTVISAEPASALASAISAAVTTAATTATTATSVPSSLATAAAAPAVITSLGTGATTSTSREINKAQTISEAALQTSDSPIPLPEPSSVTAASISSIPSEATVPSTGAASKSMKDSVNMKDSANMNISTKSSGQAQQAESMQHTMQHAGSDSSTAISTPPLSSITASQLPSTLNSHDGSMKMMTVFVSKISTTKLRNVEMMYGDKNDVFLLMKFGDKWNARTATLWEGGSDVSWSYSEYVDANMKWTGTVSDIMSGSLSITAMDDNKMTSSKLIGVGEQHIMLHGGLLQDGPVMNNTVVLVEVPLFEKIGGKAAGTVSVTLLIKFAPVTAAATEAAAAAATTAAPSVIVAAAAAAAAVRAVTEPAAVAVTSAVVSAPAPTGQTNANTDIVSNKSNTAAASVTASPSLIPQEKDLPFLTGILHLKSIKCYGLKNVETMGKNDPYIVLNFGAQNFTTSVSENAGQEAVFEYLDFKFNMSEESLKFENMTVSVFDKNSIRSDVLIGSNTVSLKNILSRQNQVTEISLEILDERGKISGKMVLFLKLIPNINNIIIEENIGIEVQVPLNYETVILRIIRIKIFDLNTVLTDKVKKPYTKISFNGNHFNTVPVPVSSTGSTYTVFDHLDFAFEVTKEVMQGDMQNTNNDVKIYSNIGNNNEMKSENDTINEEKKCESKSEKNREIEVKNKSKKEEDKKNESDSSILSIELFNTVLGFDTVIASGSISVKNTCTQNFATFVENSKIKSVPEEMEILTNLVTKKWEYAGKVVLYVTRQLKSNILILEKSKLSTEHSLESLEDVKLRESFLGGVLKIESVTIHNLKNMEIMGKQV